MLVYQALKRWSTFVAIEDSTRQLPFECWFPMPARRKEKTELEKLMFSLAVLSSREMKQKKRLSFKQIFWCLKQLHVISFLNLACVQQDEDSLQDSIRLIGAEERKLVEALIKREDATKLRVSQLENEASIVNQRAQDRIDLVLHEMKLLKEKYAALKIEMEVLRFLLSLFDFDRFFSLKTLAWKTSVVCTKLTLKHNLRLWWIAIPS